MTWAGSRGRGVRSIRAEKLTIGRYCECPSSDPAVIAEADVVVICVQTPLSSEGGPDLGAIQAAANDIAAHLHHRQLVVLESTTWPGTTQEIVAPILERSGLRAGIDFNLA